jgi:phospholipid-binding lipoprotein MlaA
MSAPTVAPAWRATLLLCVAVLGGCATTGKRHPGDPFEPANRDVWALNQGLDRAALRPAATIYHENTPTWVQNCVSNFFANLSSPRNIVHSLLQGKPVEAGQETLRFALNTTLGLGGLFDPAADANLPRANEDLGQTLGVWGVPAGPFLMVPLLGPSTLRDLPSSIADRLTEPLFWYSGGSNARWGSLTLSVLDTRARLLPLDATLAKTYDPYGFVRDAFLQRRLYLVHDGNPPEQLLDDPMDGLDGVEEPPVDAPKDGRGDPGGADGAAGSNADQSAD